MVTPRRLLAAQLAQARPRTGRFGEAALLFVHAAQRAQRAFVTRLRREHVLERARRTSRHARRTKIQAELVERALAQLVTRTLAHGERLVHADRAIVLAARTEERG